MMTSIHAPKPADKRGAGGALSNATNVLAGGEGSGGEAGSPSAAKKAKPADAAKAATLQRKQSLKRL